MTVPCVLEKKIYDTAIGYNDLKSHLEQGT